jgi:hypothetical protein
MDSVAARIFPSQLVDNDGDGQPDKLIFQVEITPGETRSYRVVPAVALPAVPPAPAKTFARFVPERMDDFAWENDRIAFRMYGPALIKGEGTVSSGIDVWAKSVRRLVINNWYKSGHYHEDAGEGLDFYKVGAARGCGGLGIWEGGKLYSSSNFSHWKMLANGPIRSVFELTYEDWDAAGRKVSEVKRISLDANSNLNRIESTFKTSSSGALTVGVGISDRGSAGSWDKKRDEGTLVYWEPEMAPNGRIACAVVIPGGVSSFESADGNMLAIAKAEPGKPFVYFAGAGWSKGIDFPDMKSWNSYVHDFARGQQSPLTVEIAK